MKDLEIIELYWRRDETAISETTKKYEKYCYSISYNILRSNEDSEECLNDTWLHAWGAIPPHRPNRLSVFLGKITRNLALQKNIKNRALKRGNGQIELVLEEINEFVPSKNNIDDNLNERVLVEGINRFLSSLQPTARNIFVLRYWYLCSVREISEKHRFSESKVKSMLYRTRQSLKTYLEEEGIIK